MDINEPNLLFTSGKEDNALDLSAVKDISSSDAEGLTSMRYRKAIMDEISRGQLSTQEVVFLLMSSNVTTNTERCMISLYSMCPD